MEKEGTKTKAKILKGPKTKWLIFIGIKNILKLQNKLINNLNYYIVN